VKDSVRSILLIEDNATDVALLGQALDQSGIPYSFHVLRDGDAVREFTAGPLPFEPCLVVLDLHIPLCTGETALRMLRNHPELTETPIAAVSGHIPPRHRETILALGADLYLEKPMDWGGTLRFAARLIEVCNARAAFAK
jgi:CheY-like chemotaxis protein